MLCTCVAVECRILILSGEDAVKFETLPDDVVVAKALSVLRSIFGDQTVPEVSSLVYSLYFVYGVKTLVISCSQRRVM